CAQRCFLYADARRVPALHTRAESLALRDDVDLSRVRINVEGDFCDCAVRAVVTGLLAVAAREQFSCVARTRDRENSIICSFGCRVARNPVRADGEDRLAGTVAEFAPARKRGSP